jgi:hypothetical protein
LFHGFPSQTFNPQPPPAPGPLLTLAFCKDMTTTIQLTDYQTSLMSGHEGEFFRACVEHFGFLVTEYGYQMSFHEMGRGFYQAFFKQDIGTEYFAIRVFHEFNHLWTEIERFAGLDHQRRMRFHEVAQLCGFTCPPELRDVVLPDEQSIAQRMQALAECIRTHLHELRNMPITQNEKSAEPLSSPERQ